jgi:AcrR family transcriptional regulator
MRLTRNESKRRTRAALIEAAAEVFARRGFGAARVEEIAERAGVTTGALYGHFKGKQDLFLAVFEDFAAVRVQQVEQSVGDAGPRAGADQWMRLLDESPWRFWLHVEFANYAMDDPDLRARYALRVAAVRLAIARLLGERYDLAVPAEWLATVIRALGMGLSLERLVDPAAIPPEMFGDAVELLLSACGATEPR